MTSVVSAVSHGPMDTEDVGGGDDGRDEEPAGSPLPPHLHRDWAHPCHIGTGTGCAPAHHIKPCVCVCARACVRVCVCVYVCVLQDEEARYGRSIEGSGACNMRMQHADATCGCNMRMQHADATCGCNMRMQHAARSVQHATKRSAQATGEVQHAPRGSAIALRFGS
jgi:hypothetical protein